MKLDTNEIAFNPLSVGADYGRVFVWNGRTYRAIMNERVQFYDNLFAGGIFAGSVRRNLVIDILNPLT